MYQEKTASDFMFQDSQQNEENVNLEEKSLDPSPDGEHKHYLVTVLYHT